MTDVTWDHEARASYIRLREGRSVRCEEVTNEIIVDFDADGYALGIEILGISCPVVRLIGTGEETPAFRKGRRDK